jgi:hypothetical protein
MAGDLGPGVVTHAVWDGMDDRLAHGFARIPTGKDVRPVAGQGMELSQYHHGLRGEGNKCSLLVLVTK